VIKQSSVLKKAEPPPTRGVDCNRSGNGDLKWQIFTHDDVYHESRA